MPNPDTVKQCYDCGKPWDQVKRATTTKHNRVSRLRRCVECNSKFQRAASKRYRDMLKAGYEPPPRRKGGKAKQVLGPKYSAVERRIQEYRATVELAQIDRRTGEAKNNIPLDHRQIW